jgi:hypothetical protein
MDEVHEESEKDRKREEVLLRELERIRPLKVRFVDTTVWQENVPQRIRLKKLKTFLKKEARKLRRMLEAFEKETKELETREHELHDGLKMTNHDIGDIQVELEDLERTFLMVGVKRQKSGEKKPKEDRVREGESLKERADRKKKREKISQMEESEKEKRALAKKRRERYSIVYVGVCVCVCIPVCISNTHSLTHPSRTHTDTRANNPQSRPRMRFATPQQVDEILRNDSGQHSICN